MIPPDVILDLIPVAVVAIAIVGTLMACLIDWARRRLAIRRYRKQQQAEMYDFNLLLKRAPRNVEQAS